MERTRRAHSHPRHECHATQRQRAAMRQPPRCTPVHLDQPPTKRLRQPPGIRQRPSVRRHRRAHWGASRGVAEPRTRTKLHIGHHTPLSGATNRCFHPTDANPHTAPSSQPANTNSITGNRWVHRQRQQRHTTPPQAAKMASAAIWCCDDRRHVQESRRGPMVRSRSVGCPALACVTGQQQVGWRATRQQRGSASRWSSRPAAAPEGTCHRRAIDTASAGSPRHGPVHQAHATSRHLRPSAASQLPPQSTAIQLRRTAADPDRGQSGLHATAARDRPVDLVVMAPKLRSRQERLRTLANAAPRQRVPRRLTAFDHRHRSQARLDVTGPQHSAPTARRHRAAAAPSRPTRQSVRAADTATAAGGPERYAPGAATADRPSERRRRCRRRHRSWPPRWSRRSPKGLRRVV